MCNILIIYPVGRALGIPTSIHRGSNKHGEIVSQSETWVDVTYGLYPLNHVLYDSFSQQSSLEAHQGQELIGIRNTVLIKIDKELDCEES